MKNKRSNQKGITLIALVVTIIVLIILAGISINLLFGDNGIIKKAQLAGEKHVSTSAAEKIKLAYVEYMADNPYSNTIEGFLEYLKDKDDYIVDDDTNEIELDSNLYSVEKIGKEIVVHEEGKATMPRIKNVQVNVENSVAQVSVETKNANGATLNYVLKEEDGVTVVSNSGNTTDTTYTFNNIDESKSYILTITITNENGTKSKNVPVAALSLEERTNGKASIAVLPNTGWQKQVTVSITSTFTGTNVIVQYKKGLSGTWTEYTDSFIVDENTTIYGRFYNTVTEEEGYKFEYQIENVDKQNPTGTITLSKTVIGKTGVSVATVTLTDALSGIDFSNSKYVINSNSGAIGTEDNLYTGGVINESPKNINISSNTIGSYYLHVLAKDLAGNKAEIVSGEVKVENRYDISTPDDLQNISDASGKYYLVNDINMAGYDFVAINLEFKGTFDGQGYTISNLTIRNDPNIQYFNCEIGLFRKIIAPATFKNLLIKNATINYTGSDMYAGILGGRSNSVSGQTVTFDKVGITGTITNNSSYGKGGFVGELRGPTLVFNNCYSRVNIITSGQYDNGGFTTLYDNPSTYNNCYFAGSITTGNGRYGRTSAFSGGCTISNNDNVHGTATLNNCYYNNSLFNATVSPSGTGLSTSQMGNRSSYASSWDFKENESDTEYTWYIDSATGYPELHFN